MGQLKATAYTKKLKKLETTKPNIEPKNPIELTLITMIVTLNSTETLVTEAAFALLNEPITARYKIFAAAVKPPAITNHGSK